MTGLIGIIANDSARYSLFAACVTRLAEWLPPGTAKIDWLIGGDWCGARNTLAQRVLDDGHDWLWFIDDDHAFPPSVLTKLLAHEVPLAVPMCLTRKYPFNTVAYMANPLEDGKRTLPVPLTAFPEDGLVALEAGGTAGMLIRREVLEAVPRPWFEHTEKSEDVLFCEKAKAAGFTLYGDLDTRIGHITTAVISPAVKDGRWITVATIGDFNVYLGPAEELLAAEQEEAPA